MVKLGRWAFAALSSFKERQTRFACARKGKCWLMWFVKLYYAVEFDDYAEIVDDDPDYAHPMAGRLWFP